MDAFFAHLRSCASSCDQLTRSEGTGEKAITLMHEAELSLSNYFPSHTNVSARHLEDLQVVGVEIFNSAQKLSKKHALCCGTAKRLSCSVLRRGKFPGLPCTRVMISAGRSFLDGGEAVRARECYEFGCEMLKDCPEGEEKCSFTAMCIIGRAESYLMMGSTPENLNEAFECLQLGLQLDLNIQSILQFEAVMISTAKMLLGENKPGIAFTWLQSLLRHHQQSFKHLAMEEASAIELERNASTSLLLQAESCLSRNDATGARSALSDQASISMGRATSAAGTQGHSERLETRRSWLELRDRWLAVQTRIEIVEKNFSAAQDSLTKHITLLKDTWGAYSGVQRIQCVMEGAAHFGHATQWQTNSLALFAELSSIATQGLPPTDIEQRSAALVSIYQKLLSELVEAAASGQRLTQQIIQIASFLRQDDCLVGHHRQVLLSKLAEHAVHLHHMARWGECETCLTALITCLQSTVSDARPIETARLLLADVYRNQRRHEDALVELDNAGTTFAANYKRLEILTESFAADLDDNGASASISEGDSSNSVALDHARRLIQEFASDSTITENQWLGIAHLLQKTARGAKSLFSQTLSILTEKVDQMFFSNTEARGQLYSNLLAEQMEETSLDIRLKIVTSTMQRLVVQLERCNAADDDTIQAFMSRNDLQFSIRCLVALAAASYRTHVSQALQLYKMLDRIQQLVGFEELQRCKILAMQAKLMLEGSHTYNHQEIVALLKTSSDLAKLPTMSNDETLELQQILAATQFRLHLRSELPGADVQLRSLLRRFRKDKRLQKVPTFFELIARIAKQEGAKASILQTIFAEELEGAVREMSTPTSRIALTFRRTISVCADNDTKIAWYVKAYNFFAENEGKLSEYPIDEMRWIISTAWNAGLTCLQAGRSDHAEGFMATAIKILQLPANASGIVTDSQKENMLLCFATYTAGSNDVPQQPVAEHRPLKPSTASETCADPATTATYSSVENK